MVLKSGSSVELAMLSAMLEKRGLRPHGRLSTSCEGELGCPMLRSVSVMVLMRW